MFSFMWSLSPKPSSINFDIKREKSKSILFHIKHPFDQTIGVNGKATKVFIKPPYMNYSYNDFGLFKSLMI